MVGDVVSEQPHLFLGRRLKRLAEQMQGEVNRFTQQAGVPVQPGQYPLLATIAEYGPQTVGDLARAMKLSQPAITRTVGRLVDAGLVQLDRLHVDKRHKTIALTSEGERAVARSRRAVWPAVEAAVREMVDGLAGSLLDQIAAVEAALSTQSLDRRASAITLRCLTPAGDADVPAIVALMNAAYRGTGSDAGWSTETGYIDGDRTSETHLRREMAEKPRAVLLVWRGDAHEGLRGCIWLEPLDGDVWYLGSLTIPPREQDAGLGRQLLAASEQWVRERGGVAIRMTVVNVRAPLLAWYVRRGYASTGETEPFPYEDNRFGVPTRDDLHFVVLGKQLAR